MAGDSHCRFWSGHDTLAELPSVFQGVDVLWVGPSTAYNAGAVRSNSDARRKISDHLSANPDRYGCIILCFGEIDCRLHILKHALIEDLTIEQAVGRVVPRYMELVDHLQATFDLPILLWGPIASAPDNSDGYNPLYPNIGLSVERNQITLSFAAALRKEAARRPSVAHFDILKFMIDDYLTTRPGFLFDGCHLGRSSMELAEKTLRQALEQSNLTHLNQALTRLPYLSTRRQRRNVADNCHYTISSEMPGVPTHRFSGKPTAGAKFHTALERRPWITFDFGSASLLDEVVVYNRSIECQDRARWLFIQSSIDGLTFEPVYQPTKPLTFGGVVEQTPFRFKLRAGTLARYLRLELHEETYFHLDFVQIFAFSFLPDDPGLA